MIYHLVPDGEPFSDIDGGALSRWVANVVLGTECIVACPRYDKTWNFVPGQLLESPMQRRYRRLRGVCSRGARFFDKLIECEAAKPLEPLMNLLLAADVFWIQNRPSVAAHLAKLLNNRGIRIVLHMQNPHLRVAGFRTIAAFIAYVGLRSGQA
jgi:hypothetical protein